METILDYLILDQYRYGDKLHPDAEFKYDVQIVEVDDNPFYLPFGDKGIHHYELQITPLHRYTDEEMEFGRVNDPLRFKMTSYSKMPTIEQFSEHIKTECRAILNALELDDEYVWNISFVERKEITARQVYKFLKNIHMNYTNTEDFLRDYDHYIERIFQGFKFFYKLTFGFNVMFSRSWDYPIGEHMLAFLEVGKYNDFYEITEK